MNAQKMSLAEISKVVLELKPGDKVKVLYKRQYPTVTANLIGMHDAGVIVLDDMAWALAYAVSTTAKWDGDKNRIFEMEIGRRWDQNWFTEKVGQDIESIELIAA